MSVLINGTSASASEMFALAMRDSYGATLVGAKSYGKGTVQQTTELSTGSLVKFTVANWLSPNGESINGTGITPDVFADMGEDYLVNQTYKNDGQLQAAIKAIK
jgi:carboxyl-terminal processing protease